MNILNAIQEDLQRVLKNKFPAGGVQVELKGKEFEFHVLTEEGEIVPNREIQMALSQALEEEKKMKTNDQLWRSISRGIETLKLLIDRDEVNEDFINRMETLENKLK